MTTRRELSEADKDVSSAKFVITLTGLEIDTVLSVIGFATGIMREQNTIPNEIDLTMLSSACDKIFDPVEEDYKIRSHPLQRDIPSSKELILLATTDFKNREERKGLHDQPSWVSGWITGFLSERKPKWSEKSINEVEKKLLEYFDTGYPSDDCLTIKEVFESLRGKV